MKLNPKSSQASQNQFGGQPSPWQPLGYGDVYPITIGGKIFASLISLIGIGIVAIPTGIISASFVEEIRLVREEKPSSIKPLKK